MSPRYETTPMKDDLPSPEQRILRAVRKVITRVARETATPPEMRHPLSQQCREELRQCLILISSRERELAGLSTARPRYVDEPPADVTQPPQPVVVPLTDIKRSSKRKDP